ncbi:hypothetical protein ON010_g14708 [Phytophthora cinnamomi]|nr:hypothetical protein ON010_g14708 [Phytophthora cinnamomi]
MSLLATQGLVGVDKIISALEPVKASYPTLSTADRIELAGQVALDDANNMTIDFMGGRTDATTGMARRSWLLQHDADLRAQQHQDPGCVSVQGGGSSWLSAQRGAAEGAGL